MDVLLHEIEPGMVPKLHAAIDKAGVVSLIATTQQVSATV
jgi:hypothetical protein